jgi:hypothetical protein
MLLQTQSKTCRYSKVADSKERNDALADVRKRNIRERNAIRAAFKNSPDALKTLMKMFDHSAEKISKATGNQVFVMLGHKEVMEIFNRTTAMENENE